MLAVRIPPSRKKSLMFAYKARQVPFQSVRNLSLPDVLPRHP